MTDASDPRHWYRSNSGPRCTCGKGGKIHPEFGIPMPHDPDCPKSWRRAFARLDDGEQEKLVKQLENFDPDEIVKGEVMTRGEHWLWNLAIFSVGIFVGWVLATVIL